MSATAPSSFDELHRHCASLQAGPVGDVATLTLLLAACWGDLVGDHGGMVGHKLPGRMEKFVWQPPTITFRIKRHGGTKPGSTRAELQRWQVDLEKKTATLVKAGHRQLLPMAGAPAGAEAEAAHRQRHQGQERRDRLAVLAGAGEVGPRPVSRGRR